MVSTDRLHQIQRWLTGFVEAYLHPPGDAPAAEAHLIKWGHTLRVADEIERLARNDGTWSDGRVRLARAAALLHDVGRFPQWTRWGTFNDAISADHAELSLRTVAEAGVLEGLDAGVRRALEVAIAHHNKHHLPAGLAGLEQSLARMLRDADKIDIWFVILEQLPCSGSSIDPTADAPRGAAYSEQLLRDVIEGRSPSMSAVRSQTDRLLFRLGWFYDLTYPTACARALERRYPQRLCSHLQGVPDADVVQRRLLAHLEACARGTLRGPPPSG